MIRIPFGVLLATIVYFGWSAAAWLVFEIHDGTIRKLPNNDAVRALLYDAALDDGAYSIPFMPKNATELEKENFLADHRRGPLVTIFYYDEGAEPMSQEMMVRGFLTDLGACIIAAVVCWHVGRAGGGFFRRAFCVALLGVFVSLTAHVSYWNWMRFPANFTQAMILDVTIGWALAGLVLAAFVWPRRRLAAAPPGG